MLSFKEQIEALRDLFGEPTAPREERLSREASLGKLDRYIRLAPRTQGKLQQDPVVMYFLAHQLEFLKGIYKARKTQSNQFSRHIEDAWFRANRKVLGPAFLPEIDIGYQSLWPNADKIRLRLRDEFRVEVLRLPRKHSVHLVKPLKGTNPQAVTSLCQNKHANKAFLTSSPKLVTCKRCKAQKGLPRKRFFQEGTNSLK